MTKLINPRTKTFTCSHNFCVWLNVIEARLIQRKKNIAPLQQLMTYDMQENKVMLTLRGDDNVALSQEVATIVEMVDDVNCDEVATFVKRGKDAHADHFEEMYNEFSSFIQIVEDWIEEALDYVSFGDECDDECEDECDAQDDEVAQEVATQEEVAQDDVASLAHDDQLAWLALTSNEQEVLDAVCKHADALINNDAYNASIALFPIYKGINPLRGLNAVDKKVEGGKTLYLIPRGIATSISAFLNFLVDGKHIYRQSLSVPAPLPALKNEFKRGMYARLVSRFDGHNKPTNTLWVRSVQLTQINDEGYHFPAFRAEALKEGAVRDAVVASLGCVHKYMQGCGLAPERIAKYEDIMTSLNIAFEQVAVQATVQVAVQATALADGDSIYVDGVAVTQAEDIYALSVYKGGDDVSVYDDAVRAFRTAQEATQEVAQEILQEVVATQEVVTQEVVAQEVVAQEVVAQEVAQEILQEEVAQEILQEVVATQEDIHENTATDPVLNMLQALMNQVAQLVATNNQLVSQIDALNKKVEALENKPAVAPTRAVSKKPVVSPSSLTASVVRANMTSDAPVEITNTSPALAKRKYNAVKEVQDTLIPANGFDLVSDARSYIVNVTDSDKAKTALHALRDSVSGVPEKEYVVHALLALFASRDGQLWNRASSKAKTSQSRTL